MPKSTADLARYGCLLLFAGCLPASKSASNILFFMLLAAVLVGAVCDRAFRNQFGYNFRQPLTVAMVVFPAVGYLGIAHTEILANGFHVANKYISLPAIYCLVSVLLEVDRGTNAGSRRAEHLLLAFLTGIMALDALGMMTYLGLIGDKKFTLPLAPLDIHHIWFANVNALGLYAAVSLLFFSPFGRIRGGRTFLGFFLLVAVACVLLSLSRTAWFSILSTAVVMVLVMVRKWKTILVAMITVMLAAAVLYRTVPLVAERVHLVEGEVALYLEGKSRTSIGARFLLWKASLMMFRSAPLLGVGTGDFVHELRGYRHQKIMPRFLREYNQPHNMYLYVLATNGVAGLAALLAILFRSVAFARPLVRAGDEQRFFAFLTLATAVHVMTASLTESFLSIEMLRYAFAFLMGVCVRNLARPLASAADDAGVGAIAPARGV